MTEVIRLGLPKGSLNTPGRGDTRQVFKDAGYEISGYESGKESSQPSIVNDPEIVTFLTRPQDSPIDLSRRLYDIAITGADWVAEERVNGGQYINQIGDLEYGRTRLVIAVAEESEYKSLSDLFRILKGRTETNPILCYTEYVNLAARAFSENEGYRRFFGVGAPFIQYQGLIREGNQRVQILGSKGATEVKIAMGADIIVDNSQSGDSLKKNHLRELGEIMVSSAGLYAGPSCVGWKERKAEEIYRKLHGAVIAKKYVDVKFNIPIGNIEQVSAFLVAQGLCADEPTIVRGEKYAQVNILVPRSTYPAMEERLRATDYGASSLIQAEIKQFIR